MPHGIGQRFLIGKTGPTKGANKSIKALVIDNTKATKQDGSIDL
jgi:hypothetical protein